MTLATNAVIAWTTEYYGPAVEQMRREAAASTTLCCLTYRGARENINFIGAIDVDIDADGARLGPTGYRRLRVRGTLF